MDHVPYPTGSTLPPVQLPLFFEYESCELDTETEDFNTSTIVRGRERSDGIGAEDPAASSLGGSFTYATSLALPQLPALKPKLDKFIQDEKKDWTSNFWHYPKKRGWAAAIGNSSWLSCSSLEAARRAQEWLYFELLHGFLGRKINPRDFSKTDPYNGQKLLDSTSLPDLLAYWTSSVQKSQSDLRFYADGKVLSLLEQVTVECRNFDNIPDASLISFAIQVLVDTLAKAVLNLRCSENHQLHGPWKLGPHGALRERMLANHWCPFQINRFWGEYTSTAMYYLSSLPRMTTFGGVTHSKCTKDKCSTTSVDLQSYKPSHTDECPSKDEECSMIGVNTDEIATIINRGGIPLIMFDQSLDGQIQLKVVESRHGLRYVAISHVWSGGLGNVNANCMHVCQLRQIRLLLRKIRANGDDDLDRDLGTRKWSDLAQDLRERYWYRTVTDSPLLFWIDTLCVPVGLEHQVQGGAYSKAIGQMAQIYVEAQCVLVLDPELQKSTYRNLSDLQIFASILCSSWNARSWTFQEACMARIFLVQFADGHCIVDERWHEFTRSFHEARDPDSHTTEPFRAMNMQDLLMFELSSWFEEMPVMTKIRVYDNRLLMSKSDDWRNFADVWNGLRTKSTTKIDDLYGIVAVMADLSANEILNFEQSKRMRAILRSQSSLPLPLLYGIGPRSQDQRGNTIWAPSTITGEPLERRNGFMMVAEYGLTIDPSKSKANDHDWPRAYIFSTQSPFVGSITLRLSGSDEYISVELHDCRNTQATVPAGDWLLLFDDTLRRGSAMHQIPGVLLSLVRVKAAVYHTSYFCPIRILLASSCPGSTSVHLLVDEMSERALNTERLPWKKSSVMIDSGMISLLRYTSLLIQLIDPTDMTSWPKPTFRLSKRLNSIWVRLRVISTAWELPSAGITSSLYIAAIIGCAVHSHQPLVREILWLLIARWATHLLDLYWILKALIMWDQSRTSRWSTKLYGDNRRKVWQDIRNALRNPVFASKIIPLCIGTTSIGLYQSFRWPWAKWFAVVSLTEVAFRIFYTGLFTLLSFWVISKSWIEITMEDLSDLPEDLTNYTGVWEAGNRRETWRLEMRAQRRAKASEALSLEELA